MEKEKQKLKIRRYNIRGAGGLQPSVFEDEKGKKNVSFQLGISEDKLPELKNGYYNIRIYANQIEAAYNGLVEICESEDIPVSGSSTALVGEVELDRIDNKIKGGA